VNDPNVFRRDCFKPNCATTLSINVTVPQAADRGEISATSDWSLVSDVILAMGLLRVVGGQTVDADFVRQVIDMLILPAVRTPTTDQDLNDNR